MNKEALAHCGLLRQKKKKKTEIFSRLITLVFGIYYNTGCDVDTEIHNVEDTWDNKYNIRMKSEQMKK
jgi:hypothetical protein